MDLFFFDWGLLVHSHQPMNTVSNNTQDTLRIPCVVGMTTVYIIDNVLIVVVIVQILLCQDSVFHMPSLLCKGLI